MIEEEKQQDNLEQQLPDEPSAESPQQSDATSVEEPTPSTEAQEQPPVPDAELSEAEDDADDEPEEKPVSAEESAAAAAAAEQAAAVEALMMSNQAYQAQIEQLKEQSEELKAQYSRLAADFDNFRKRTEKEKEDLDLQSKCSTIRELLPVIDNFERARSHLKPQTETEMNIHKSYQSVYKQMVDALKKIGVSPMRPEGQEFDPNLHEAVMREPTDKYDEGVVVEELMRGYMIGERILRHAMVKVAVAPEPVESSEEETPPETPPTEE
jgi:molecular chaperone GrpE